MSTEHIHMESISFQATLMKNNQITIPIETREYANVSAGDTLNLVIIGMKPSGNVSRGEK